MATLTNQLHTVGIYITTRRGPIRPKSAPLSEALHYPNRAPPRQPSAPNIVRERAFAPWARADGTMAAAKDSPTTIRPPPLRAGIRTQWSRRAMPSSITGKRQPSADSSNEPWYCIASRRELFTGSAAGRIRAHSSICGTTDSGAYSRLSFWLRSYYRRQASSGGAQQSESSPDQTRR